MQFGNRWNPQPDSQTGASEVLPPSRRRPHVLCIERDAAVAEAIAKRLGEHQIDVLWARNGMQGYWLAMSKQPDLIITDLRMTNGHGGEVLQSLKANGHTRDIPVIVLTSHRYPGLREHVARMGASECLEKPPSLDLLVAKLAAYVNVA